MQQRYVVPSGRRGSVIGDRELGVLARLVSSDATLSAGGWREAFEQAFARHVGARHALSVTSGTVALEIAIRLLDLAPGDEVVVTPQTFQASIQPLLDKDVEVRFCDIDPLTLNMDPTALQSLITDRTRAVILVHYGGCPADMDAIMKIARPRGIPVIEDSAHALGATYHGRRPGSLADIATFSFHSTKNITTLGEGGMITLDRDDWAKRVSRYRNNTVDGDYVHHSDAEEIPGALPWMMFSDEIYGRACARIRNAGTNATLSEAAAAVGLSQLDRLDELVERRRLIAGRLDEVVAAFPGAQPLYAPRGVSHAYHLYTFLAHDRNMRDALLRELDERGVEVQLRYFPLHLTPEWRFRGHGPGECPVAEHLWFERHMNLPCHPGLVDSQVDHLVDTLAAALTAVTGPAAKLRGGAAATV
ncbi:DegT/DnrJ/EryC1/StrS family aminotransferase [Dactylosporangium fulvum]|uniref:DegT/DnrJ/EryC1/StrS family aminotransferase n=1 Tax=Dactylosporangium fulvum TaxID=53359 RepID=A0ABY5W769_9ACTN|nr:DegT/DnrJ/EryC1/StrS family aminotransferase [Dactylosporangium fulvum]UWP85377.1 DegT/DnrJ/EryC1/StrS family aminotransferase [Dactylosporangium fulvum]